MAAVLVTLIQAKAHLRITLPALDPGDVDIQLKLDQAEAVILDYLKNQFTAIASIAAGNPAVVTTGTKHGLTTGVTYTISDTTTTPTINGARVVTVTGPTTFTVPVNVTVGQAAAAGLVSTPVWTAATVSPLVQASILLLLAHLFEHRGDDLKADADLWAAIARLLVRHRDPALA